MVYNWAPYEDECFRLFIEEGKSVAEVQRYMREQYNFEPSTRGYEVQFKRWGFSSKRGTPAELSQITDRVRQLWEANTSRTEMLKVLADEGFRVSEPQLRRVRQKNGWMLRGGTAYGHAAAQAADSGADNGDGEPEEEDEPDSAGAPEGNNYVVAPLQVNAAHVPYQTFAHQQHYQQPYPEPMQPNLAYAYQTQQPVNAPAPTSSHHNPPWAPQMQLETPRSKKKRRRLQSHGDDSTPSGPPRFPSETTLDEAKAFLHMSNENYRSVRNHLQDVCEETGVVRKAGAAAGEWEGVKTRLVAEHDHLRKEFHGPFNGVPREQKDLALDAIAMSVTKMMRKAGKAVTIADAKIALNLNPNEARQIRAHFYAILSRDKFTKMSDSGLEHYNELKRQWLSESPILQQALGADPDAAKKKASDRLASDVLKRYRDDCIKRNPSLKGNRNIGPGPGPVYKGANEQAATSSASSKLTGTGEKRARQVSSSHAGRDSEEATEDDETPSAFPRLTPHEGTPGEIKPGHTAMGVRTERPPPSERPENRNPRVAKEPRGDHPQPSRKRKSTQATDISPQPAAPPGSANSHRSKLQQEQMQQRRQQQARPQQPAQAPASAQTQVQEPTQAQQPPEALHETRRQVVETSEQTQQPLPRPQPTQRAPAQQTQPLPTPTNPVAALFRLGPQSTLHSTKTMWFAMLTTHSLNEIVAKAAGQFNDVQGRTVVVRKIEGILADETGGEAGFPIQSNEELEAYLGWMNMGRCVFVVTLDSVVN